MSKNVPEEQFPERTADAALGLIKLVALANAGGVAATVTGIGAIAKNGASVSVLAVPLLLFSMGVASTIGYALSLYLRIAMYEGFEPSPPKWLVGDAFLRGSGYVAIVLFILGCLFGALIVFIK